MQTTEQARSAVELALGERINALLSATRGLSERSAAQFHEGLQPAAFHIARWLHAFGPARPSVIAESVGMDRSSTSTLLTKMRSLGLVANAPDPQDRRGVIVQLTDLGEARIARTLEERGVEFFGRIKDWSLDDLRALERLLGKLTADPSTR
ncbi:DNA-binding MarR family transcriptional regulator [Microbacterium natoriense]|uniref:DNA-binding MarR family transcriptional regulator n=1 Tax=Microbacterium natoriense TaxID=284570 RepID=A0AAW8EVM1_9MICO|nr:MarR family transcriptional regulator [Microbacterium natoriense]MDQ0646924.1 DNA-binding MarR family transcriptional regulator [Microbacterium natoriense]